MKKKILSLALALTMCLGLTVPAFAADGTTVTSDTKEPLNITFDGYLRTEYVDAGEEDTFFAVFVVEDGSTIHIDRSEHAVQYGVLENCYGYSPEMGVFWLDSGPLRLGGSLGGDMSTITWTASPAETIEDACIYQVLVPGFGLDSYCWMCESDFARIASKHKGIPGPDSEIFGTVGPATENQPQQPAEVKTANPTNDKLEVNGAAQDPTVYKIGGSNYFKIRDVAAVLNGTEKQFAVGYSGGKVTVTSGQPYEATGKELAGAPAAAKEASPSNDAIVIDGMETSLTVYKIGGSNYFKLRDLGKALNFYVGWEAGRGVFIETDKPYSE